MNIKGKNILVMQGVLELDVKLLNKLIMYSQTNVVYIAYEDSPKLDISSAIHVVKMKDNHSDIIDQAISIFKEYANRGEIDIYFNPASTPLFHAFEESESFNSIDKMNHKLIDIMKITQLVYDKCKKTSKRLSVVTPVSMFSVGGFPCASIYSAKESAISLFIDSLQMETIDSSINFHKVIMPIVALESDENQAVRVSQFQKLKSITPEKAVDSLFSVIEDGLLEIIPGVCFRGLFKMKLKKSLKNNYMMIQSMLDFSKRKSIRGS